MICRKNAKSLDLKNAKNAPERLEKKDLGKREICDKKLRQEKKRVVKKKEISMNIYIYRSNIYTTVYSLSLAH